MKRQPKWENHTNGLAHTLSARLSVSGIGNGEIYRMLLKLNFGARLLPSALAVVLTLGMSSLSFAGSKMPDSTYSAEDILKPLSKSTVEALQKETGVRPFYVMIFTKEGPIVIGEAPGVKGEFFDSQEKLWKTKGKITIDRIERARSSIRFHASPGQFCDSLPGWGSGGSFFDDFWYCPPLLDQ